jgi:hypothetical protein
LCVINPINFIERINHGKRRPSGIFPLKILLNLNKIISKYRLIYLIFHFINIKIFAVKNDSLLEFLIQKLNKLYYLNSG